MRSVGRGWSVAGAEPVASAPKQNTVTGYSGSFGGGGGACFSLDPLLWGVTTMVLPGP
jgi:hypothetical protein